MTRRFADPISKASTATCPPHTSSSPPATFFPDRRAVHLYLHTPTPTMSSNEQPNSLTESAVTVPSDSEQYSGNDDLSLSPPSSSSSPPMILYSPPSFWGLVRGAAINLLLPFVNGLMLGFGELFAHEAAFRLGWGGTKVILFHQYFTSLLWLAPCHFLPWCHAVLHPQWALGTSGSHSPRTSPLSRLMLTRLQSGLPTCAKVAFSRARDRGS
jgi:hypothetical protein